MLRRTFATFVTLVAVLAGAAHSQGRLEIRAASSSPVDGWRQVKGPDRDRPLWIAPTNQLTGDDVERAEAGTGPDGRETVTVVFTDAGARKMAELSADQLDQPIAILLDGEVISAPIVRQSITRDAVLSGGPEGLTPEVVQRLLSAIPRQR